MRLWKLPHTIRGQLLIGLLGGVMMIGPAGCTALQFGGIASASDNPFGLIINTDVNSNILGAIRLISGESVFVFGTHQPDGNIQEVTAAVVRDEEGNEATLTFESGRPKKAVAFDGSTIEVTYEEVGSLRLKGRVDIFLASATENQNQSFDFDIDLAQAAAELAQLIQDLAGVEVTEQEPPEDPAGRARIPDEAAISGAKQLQNAQWILWFIVPFYTFAFATIGFVMMQMMSQIMQLMVSTMVGIIAGITRAALLSAFVPFFIMGNLMRGSATETIITIDFDQLGSGVIVPGCPAC